MTEETPILRSRVVGSVTISGAAAAVIAWAWNGYIKDPAMTPEIAVALAMLLGPALAWAVSWLPHPKKGDQP